MKLFVFFSLLQVHALYLLQEDTKKQSNLRMFMELRWNFKVSPAFK